jgi:peptide chain release factor subunit 3
VDLICTEANFSTKGQTIAIGKITKLITPDEVAATAAATTATA